MSDFTDDFDEDIDIDDELSFDSEMLNDGDDNGDDFSFKSISNTAPFDVNQLSRARALVKTTDESILHAMDTLEIIASTYGDLHEDLRRKAEDLMSTFRAFHLEMDRFPGRVLARVIYAEPDRTKRLNKAVQARDEINNLIRLLKDEN